MATGHKVLVNTLACALCLCFLGMPACRKASPTGPSLSGQPGASGVRCLEKRKGKVILTRADAHFVNWDGRLALVVLVDFSGGRISGSSGGNTGWFEGYNESFAGRRVEWRWETRDGKSGTVVINGQKYDRFDGGLFLVYTKGEKLRVVQLKRDFEGDEKDLSKLAVTDPDIERFVAEAAEW